VWLSQVRRSGARQVEVDWQPFSLAQVNSDQGEEFRYWEQPGALDGSDNTLLALRAGLAARRQGQEAFDAFFMNLLTARHRDKRDLMDAAVVHGAAKTAGLDMSRFLEDLADPELVREVGASHTRAVEEHGVFGVPTVVFPNGHAAFLKMFVPPEAESVTVFDSLVPVIGGIKHVGEIKRPQPPWPKGVL
jgi:predicted DsbA family dithiol-disulfide isomerase